MANNKSNPVIRVIVDIILSAAAFAGFIIAIVANSAFWFIGFVLMLAGVYGLIALETDYIDRFRE